MKKYIIIIPILLVFYFVTLDYKSLGFKKSNNDVSLNTKDNIKDDAQNNLSLVDSEKTKESFENLVKVSYNGEENTMPIDEYVLGVVACEVPASFHEEALKAMSVVARSFYLYKDSKIQGYVANNSEQCFSGEEVLKEKWGENYQKYYDIVKKSVEDTVGEFVTYNGEVAQTFYFSMSNGKTENLENVFSEKRPYLVSVNSSWDENVSSFESTVNFSLVEFLEKLGLDKSNTVTVDIVSKTSSGRVESLKVNNVLIKGTEFRKKLGLRSTDFDVYLGQDIAITTRGYGHGVGMSQWGANEMAKLGYTYKDIIKYYYKGVEISNL